MHESRLDTVTQRLDRLERQVRRWKTLASVSVALLSLGFLLGSMGDGGSTVSDEIRAKQFSLVDANGKVRAGLRVGSDGSTALALADPEGRTRAGLAVLPDGSARLRLYDEDEKARAGLDIGADGSATLALAGRDGELFLQGMGRERVPIRIPSLAGGGAGSATLVVQTEGQRVLKSVTTYTTRSAGPVEYRAVDAERLTRGQEKP